MNPNKKILSISIIISFIMIILCYIFGIIINQATQFLGNLVINLTYDSITFNYWKYVLYKLSLEIGPIIMISMIQGSLISLFYFTYKFIIKSTLSYLPINNLLPPYKEQKQNSNTNEYKPCSMRYIILLCFVCFIFLILHGIDEYYFIDQLIIDSDKNINNPNISSSSTLDNIMNISEIISIPIIYPYLENLTLLGVSIGYLLINLIYTRSVKIKNTFNKKLIDTNK